MAAARTLPPATLPSAGEMPVQEKGQRPARPLPYLLDVTGTIGDGAFALTIANRGTAGACLAVYAENDGPWLYTCEADRTLNDQLPVPSGGGSFRVHGPNGFLRVFQDTAPYSTIAVESHYDAATEELVLNLRNTGMATSEISIKPLAYSDTPARRHQIAPAGTIEDRWPIAAGDHWYDVELRSGSAVWRLAGHAETGNISRSDPAIG
jgi:phospholipase C